MEIYEKFDWCIYDFQKNCPKSTSISRVVNVRIAIISFFWDNNDLWHVLPDESVYSFLLSLKEQYCSSARMIWSRRVMRTDSATWVSLAWQHDFQMFIEKVTKTAVLALIKYKKGSEPIISSESFLFVESFYSRIKLNASEYGIKPPWEL